MNSLRDDATLSNVIDNNTWYNDFADKLISGNFLLTALEFHAELIESGRELTKLKEFFSNPGNFEHLASSKPEISHSVSLPRSSSQATLDSLDLTRYSEDGERSNDDRVAVLEFELRKARETIVALRANLTVATETDNKQKSQEKSKDHEDAIKVKKSTIKPHEQRALNFLINEYLLLHGYKLTSITFSDENESQDFDDWDDVGLNVGRPVELLDLYRQGLKASGCSESILSCDFDCQVSLDDDDDDDARVHLKERVSELEEEVAKLNDKISSLNLEFENRLQTLGNQEVLDVESHVSLSPDQEYFEIIDNIKSREESETKSDKSNGDWLKIGDKCKRDSTELASDGGQVNCENDKSRSSLFDNLTVPYEDVYENEKTCDDCDDDDAVEASNLDNFQEAVIDVSMEYAEKENCEENYASNDKSRSASSLGGGEWGCVKDTFRNEFLLCCNMNIPMYNGEKILPKWFYQRDPNYFTLNQVVDILSDSLPKIIPNIILNKREEIMPLLILSVCLNPSSSVRDKLLHLLFNLKKKPQEDERRMILSALSLIAKLMGSDSVENEILPQCWEQITHKYYERRMLVAESCFILLPHVSEAIRNSLAVSITRQLLQDREENVRKSAVSVLALLIVLVTDEDKYQQIADLCFETLSDESPVVVDSVRNLLFPVLAHWSYCLDRVRSHLFPKLLQRLKTRKSLLVVSVMEKLLSFLVLGIAKGASDSSEKAPPPSRLREFLKLYNGLSGPLTFCEVESVKRWIEGLDACTSNPAFEAWPQLEWIWTVLTPALLELGDDAAEDATFLMALTSCFKSLCLGLGQNVTNHKMKPLMLEKLRECESLVVAGEKCQHSVIPFYLAGILSASADADKEMDVTLRKLICVLPQCGVSLTPLQAAVELLTQCRQWQCLVLDGIWEGVAHQRPLVRSASAKLFQSVVRNVSDDLLGTKVVPALITLSSDPEMSVRTSSVPTLGMLTACKDKAIKDKVYMTLQGVFQESGNMSNHAMVVQFARTIEKIYESCDRHFREEVVVPQLHSMAAHASHGKSADLVDVLTDVFATVSFSQNSLSFHCISTHLLPGLRHLENACGHVNSPCKDRIDSMIKEVERHGAASRGTGSSSDARKLVPASMSTQVVVEDVKNRVTKMFNAKPNSLQNVFKKKS